MGFYDRWKYRAFIRITNPVAQTDFQHVINVAWRKGMRNDFRDLRFTTMSGQKIPHWIAIKTNSSTAEVWIKVPAASTTAVWMFYGNGSATDAESITSVMLAGDDFKTFTGWTSTWGTWSVTNGILSQTANSAGAIVKPIGSNLPSAFIYECRFRGNSSASEGIRSGLRDGTAAFSSTEDLEWTIAIGGWANGRFYFCNDNQGSVIYDSKAYTVNVWYRGKLVQTGAPSMTGYIDNDQCGSTALTNSYTLNALAMTIYSGQKYASWDWVYVRKYAATEPTLAVAWVGRNPSGQTSDWAFGGTVGTEYAFDPVNVDHTMSAAIGVQEIEMTNNVDHSQAAGVGVTELDLGAVNINHPIYPTASWSTDIVDPVDETGEKVTARVSKGMDDAMAHAEIDYAGNAMGNYYSGDYMTKFILTMRDAFGVDNTIFVGVMPSSRATYSPTMDKIVMNAVDHGLYLTKQHLGVRDLSLLPPDEQDETGANVAKVLLVDGIVHGLQIGQKIIGQGSNAWGYIAEIVNGHILTLYPASGKFVDDEELFVGGVKYAMADGRSIDVPYTPYYQTTGPEDWVRSVLGGANWKRVTGLYPWRITSTGGYWDTDSCPAVPFMFGTKETKWECLKRMAKYLRYMVHIKPRLLGTEYVPAFYFVPIDSIDGSDGLDLPTPATLTYGSSGSTDLYPYLAAPVELDQSGEDQVDLVRVACQTLEGVWLEAKKCNSKVDYGEGPYLEFYDEPQDIATQTDLNAYCDDMYNLYVGRGCTWKATVLDRPDLELYQLINVSGFGIEIPDGEYRIVHIEYERGPAVNKTHITFMLKSAFSSLLKRGRVYTDSIVEISRVANHEMDKLGETELGLVTATDGYTINYETEAGVQGRGRDGTSTSSAVGVTPVGAKVAIHHTRGGIVCIPVIGGSGSSTDLLVVDVPTIVHAVVDANDHNYWILEWTPGTNNQNVSVNYQLSTYPSAPGTVAGGPELSRYTGKHPRSTTCLRFRFSGPLATYYVKLWGEKNGNYSATGAIITITSGSDVTVPGGQEEPEPINVTDYMIFGQSLRNCEGHKGWYTWGTVTIHWNGTDNLYIGGSPTEESWPPEYNCGTWRGARKMMLDDGMRITGPKGVLTTGSFSGCSWVNPIDIKSILNPGANSVKIEIYDASVNPAYWYGASSLWVRSYYL